MDHPVKKSNPAFAPLPSTHADATGYPSNYDVARESYYIYISKLVIKFIFSD